jgi:hypothetical protein
MSLVGLCYFFPECEQGRSAEHFLLSLIEVEDYSRQMVGAPKGMLITFTLRGDAKLVRGIEKTMEYFNGYEYATKTEVKKEQTDE